VQVELNEDDYVAFVRGFYSKEPGGRRVGKANNRLFLLMFCICAAAILLTAEGMPWVITLAVIALAGVVFLGLSLLAAVRYRVALGICLRASPNRAFFAPSTVTVRARGHCIGIGIRVKPHKMAAVDTIFQTETHVSMILWDLRRPTQFRNGVLRNNEKRNNSIKKLAGSSKRPDRRLAPQKTQISRNRANRRGKPFTIRTLLYAKVFVTRPFRQAG